MKTKKNIRKLMKRVKIVVNKNMVSSKNDPFVLKKNDLAWRSIEKYKILEQLAEWDRLNPKGEKK
jgi:hypothetical protein